jgi:DNA-binding HxlR family transcriptional regulator
LGTFKYPVTQEDTAVDEHADSYRERDRCPVYTALRVIEGRWKPMICRRLGEGAQGFGELYRAMPGVTPKVLRQHLRQMEADGIVVRTVRRQKPALRVSYAMTPYGRTLGPVFETLWRWGVKHLEREMPPRSDRFGDAVMS